MYLSLLKLNPRSRKAVVEAFRPYELHRSLMRAFPKRECDGPGRVLVRLDMDREDSGMSLLVQSENKPDWTALSSVADFLLEEPKCKHLEPTFSPGQLLYFRLRANPTVKRNGKRLGIIRENDQIDWLNRKGEEGGFNVVSVTVMSEGIARDKMTDSAQSGHDLSLLSVRFEGVLRVVEAMVFRRTLECGIGSGKGLGFGLLSVAPIRS